MASEAIRKSGAQRQEAPGGKKRFSFFSTREGGVDLTFMILVLLLLSIGLVMLFSASYPNALYYRGNSFIYISHQLVFAAAGVTLMMIISTLNYKMLEKLAWPILVGTVIMLGMVFFFPPINNARRWIQLPLFNIQPSEIAKFAIVVFFAYLIVRNYNKMHTFKYGVLPFLPVLGIFGTLIILQPHLSGTILVLSIGAIMMFIGGIRVTWLVLAAAIGLLAIGGLLMVPGVLDHAMVRIMHWRDPFIDPRGAGFQTIQSLLAIGSGGLMGVGIGNSRQKFLYLPEPQNDFIFSIVSEELGFVGATLIILLFALLVWRGFVIGMRCRDRFGSLMAVGLTSQVGLQTVLNIMVVTNTIPNTGVSLPFFSYGGSSLVMLLCQMGVVLAISRNTDMEKV